jgi:MFS transporter, ACS family, glucarate transporter
MRDADGEEPQMSMRITGRDVVATAAWYRWVILFVCWLTFLLSFVDRLTWANVAVSVGGSLGLPIAALGVFVTAFYVGYVVCNVAGGFASDRIGGRATLTLSMLALGACTFLFGFTTSVTMGLVVQALMGLSAGADYASCIKLIVAWFDRDSRGRAMGLFMIASSLGVFATNALVPSLAASLGWRGVYHALGAITAVVGVVGYLVLRDGPATKAPAMSSAPGLWPLLGSRTMILLALAGFGGLWGTWGFAFWANALMIKQRGLSPVEAGFVVSLVGVAAIVGKPVFGWLSDRLGGRPKWLVIGSFALFTVMLVVFGTLHDRLSFQLAAPLLGLGAFVYSPLMAVLVAEEAGAALAGAATGLTAGFWQLGSVIVPLAVGLVFQVTGSFMSALLVLAAGPSLGAMCMLFVKERGTAGKSATSGRAE